MGVATPRCGDCRFSNPAVMSDAPVLECRRYPPQIFAVDGNGTQTFPHMDGDEWCGEFEAR